MIIGIDGSRAFSDSKTGTENYSYQIIRNLAKIDRDNSYLIYLRPFDPEQSRRTQGKPGISFSDWPDNFKFKVLNFKRLWTQIGLAQQTFKDKIDVLFVPAHTLPIVRRSGLKTVVTVHDLGSEYLPKSHQLKQRLYLSYMQKRQLRGATHLIAVSEATKDDLVKRIGIDPKNITVVYEAYDQELFKPVKKDIQVSVLKQYDIESGEYFLFVGTIQPRKNLERLITAFSSSRSRRFARDDKLKLVLVGKKGWLSEEIYTLPEKLGIKDLVKFLDYVPIKDLPALYSGAIALTFPSLFEGFGLPILEAQACGCPVLTSNISSMPEVAGKGAVLVDPYSIDDIVKGLERVQSSEFRVQNVKAGFENVKRFSWEKAAEETLEVLEKLNVIPA